MEVLEVEKPPLSHVLSEGGGGGGVGSGESPSISRFELGRGWWKYQEWGNPSVSRFERGRGGGGAVRGIEPLRLAFRARVGVVVVAVDWYYLVPVHLYRKYC